jgi:hypothetical protein
VATPFHIDILDQGWLEPSDESDYDPAVWDLCSHGHVRLVVGDQIILDSTDGDYGISEAALAMLRTLEDDHTPASPVAERMIPHGCGAILMMGCPIGINWTVEHRPGSRVRITNVTRYDTTDEAAGRTFPGADIELPLEEYVREIVAFAEQAKEPFAGVSKEFSDDYDRDEYERFWTEYDERLGRAISR